VTSGITYGVIDRTAQVYGYPAAGAEDLAGSLEEFLGCLESGDAPMTGCHDNIKSLAMVLGALEAAESGRTVNLFETPALP